MSEVRRPLTLITVREEDYQRVEGGGTEDPKWVLSGELLISKAKKLSHSLRQVIHEERIKAYAQAQISHIISVSLEASATAKTRRVHIVDFLRTTDKNPVIGLKGSDVLLVEVDSLPQFEVLGKRLERAVDFPRAISCIESFSLYDPQVEIMEQDIFYKLKLLDFGNRNINDRNAEKMTSLLLAQGFEFSSTKYLKRGSMIYKLKNTRADQIEHLRNTPEFGLVEELVPMPRFSIELDSHHSLQSLPFIRKDPDVRYTTLGVLDSGISELPSFKPWLVEERFSQYPRECLDFDHGTQVASVALFGDILEGVEWVGRDGIGLVDCAVIPNGHNTQIDEDELISNIQEAMNQFPEVHVWNMSFSLKDESCPDSYSDFAKVLDELQIAHNNIICKSCGNNFNLKKDIYIPITAGSESAMCITVGSMAHKQREGDYAMIDHPSPFTRSGPGPNFLIKPDVAHYGGNAKVDPANHRIVPTGVSVISQSGMVVSTIGSSVATPRVSGLACRLSQSLDQPFDPLLIKALIIHSAQYPHSLTLTDEERVNLCGYGIPSSVQNILYDGPDEITLIIRAALPKSRKIEILDFPMPECLIKDGFFTGRITATLVHTPLIDTSQGLEFCQSEIELQFGSYSQKVKRDMSKSNILNPVGRENSKNVFTNGVISKPAMRSSSHLASERALVYRGKYHPVKKYVADLDTFTKVSKERYLSQERSWYLHLQGLYRDQITRKYRDMEKELPPLEYCLVLTIKDPLEKNRLNDEAIQKLDYYNFWHQSLQLSSEIQISV